MVKKKMRLSVGFATVEKRANKISRAVANCSSCFCYDEKEGCTNPYINRFDITEDGDSTYCYLWNMTRAMKPTTEEW